MRFASSREGAQRAAGRKRAHPRIEGCCLRGQVACRRGLKTMAREPRCMAMSTRPVARLGKYLQLRNGGGTWMIRCWGASWILSDIMEETRTRLSWAVSCNSSSCLYFPRGHVRKLSSPLSLTRPPAISSRSYLGTTTAQDVHEVPV